MPKCEFTKEFDILIDDFNAATQKAIAALTDDSKKPDADPDAEPVDEDDIFSASLDRLYAKTKKDFQHLDKEYKELEDARKEYDKEIKERNAEASRGKVSTEKQPSAEEVNAELLKPLTVAADRLGKSLENFTLRIHSQLVGCKELGDKFVRASNILFIGLKKLDGEVDKFAAAELKRKPREVKELEVIPSKFLAEFKEILKKNDPETDDPKLTKALKDAEERLKRVDTNNTFDKVTSVCEAAQGMIKDVMKHLGKDDAKLTRALKDLVADIEKYDNHMFLLSRMR